MRTRQHNCPREAVLSGHLNGVFNNNETGEYLLNTSVSLFQALSGSSYTIPSVRHTPVFLTRHTSRCKGRHLEVVGNLPKWNKWQRPGTTVCAFNPL